MKFNSRLFSYVKWEVDGEYELTEIDEGLPTFSGTFDPAKPGKEKVPRFNETIIKVHKFIESSDKLMVLLTYGMTAYTSRFVAHTLSMIHLLYANRLKSSGEDVRYLDNDATTELEINLDTIEKFIRDDVNLLTLGTLTHYDLHSIIDRIEIHKSLLDGKKIFIRCHDPNPDIEKTAAGLRQKNINHIIY